MRANLKLLILYSGKDLASWISCEVRKNVALSNLFYPRLNV